ncbi:MAG TPA: DUF4157 domain-containing protein [Kofleriaceae bacterium]|nr:DUF4157 domain-containing protein [Kofleriaceae bacterium]
MSTEDDDLTDEELAESSALHDDIVKRWDPERLLKMVSKRAGRGERLDEATRAKYEARFGADLSRVRVYTGEFAEEITRAHNAEAITVGTTGMILMGGSPDRSMATTAGQALLAHELTHVAQSERGVHRRGTFGGTPELAHDEAEAEAEAAEQQEHAEASGAEQQNGENEAEADEALGEALKKRVFELFAEAELVGRLRNGDDPFRP